MKIITIYYYILLSVSATKTFITDNCKTDSDCISGCCGFDTGKCAGPIIAVQRDGGCGFGDITSNDKIARSLGFNGKIFKKERCICD